MKSAALLIVIQLIVAGNDGAVMGTLAGNGSQGFSGDGGPAASAQLDQPFDVKYDSRGHLYVTDTFNHRIRRIDAKTGVISTVAGNGVKGFSGDGGPAVHAQINEPYGVVIDRDGAIYFADRINRRIRRVDGATGVISTIAGNGAAAKVSSGDGGPGTKAGLVEPNGVALDGEGKLYIADVAGHRVRVLDLKTGIIATFAGDGKPAHRGDGGPASQASIHGARAVRVAPDGAVLILEREGNRLRSVDPRTGVIVTIAGTGEKGYSGDGGPAIKATFNGPKELDVAPNGDIAIVDTENHAIRLIDAKTGVIRTAAGDGKKGGGGDGRAATTAQMDRPHGVAFLPGGNGLAIGDTNNHRARSVLPAR